MSGLLCPAEARNQTRVSLPWFITMLGEAEALDGNMAGAFDAFAEALSVSPLERQYRPLTLISRGEYAAQIGDITQAEKDFREAIALSETMGATSCRLRAMTALARLRDGKELRARLAETLDRIVGGADSRDIKEARALIEAQA